MAPKRKNNTQKFIKVQAELESLQESYNELDHRYKALREMYLGLVNKSKRNEEMDISDNEEEAEMPSMDPLILIPDACDKIFGYLKAKELMTAMEVSKGWKNFIESRSKLMNYAMEKIVLVPQFNDCSLETFNTLFSPDREKRPFKHLVGSIVHKLSFGKVKVYVEPFHYYAATLETLDLRSRYRVYEKDEEYMKSFYFWFFHAQEDSYEIPFCEFPKLKKIRCSNDVCGILHNFSFPEVTHVLFEDDDDRIMLDGDLLMRLYCFPNLTTLCYSFAASPFGHLNGGDSDSEDSENLSVDPNLPKIKQIRMEHHQKVLVEQLKDSLEVYQLSKMLGYELTWLLHNMKVLKSLSVTCLEFDSDDLDEEYFDSSLEVLRIGFARNVRIDKVEIVKRLLKVLPSLKEFVLQDCVVNAELVRFIASNIDSLKSFKCKELADEAMEAYQEIKANPSGYKNTSFELSVAQREQFRWTIWKNEVAEEAYSPFFRVGY